MDAQNFVNLMLRRAPYGKKNQYIPMHPTLEPVSCSRKTSFEKDDPPSNFSKSLHSQAGEISGKKNYAKIGKSGRFFLLLSSPRLSHRKRESQNKQGKNGGRKEGKSGLEVLLLLLTVCISRGSLCLHQAAQFSKVGDSCEE